MARYVEPPGPRPTYIPPSTHKSLHFRSLLACFLPCAERAADPAVVPASTIWVGPSDHSRRSSAGLVLGRRASAGLVLGRRASAGLVLGRRTSAGLVLGRRTSAGLVLGRRTSAGLVLGRRSSAGLVLNNVSHTMQHWPSTTNMLWYHLLVTMHNVI